MTRKKLPPAIGVSREMKLSELIRAAEERGYIVEAKIVPNKCPHGKPCCEECKRLPENQHSITVIE